MARTFAKQVGVLWSHKHEKVGNFMSGVLDLGPLGEIAIAIFKNDRKEKGKKHPDYRIVLSQRSGGGAQDGTASAQPADELPY
jgi:hypothetical protein